MAYEEKYRAPETPHSVFLENRSKLALTGVLDVESFDEEEVALSTQQGSLVVSGSGLHVEKLNLDSGDVMIRGVVDTLRYEDSAASSGGFFSRMFREK